VSTLEPKILVALNAAKRLARSLDDIRGIDYGLKYQAGKQTDSLCIRFHMDRKKPVGDLPLHQRLPDSIEGVAVDVLSSGYALHDGNPRGAQSVLRPGISVGNIKTKTTGTLGAFVRDLTTGDLCILSNWHVFCGAPEAAAGDSIGQPGAFDSGSNPIRSVASLERWSSLSEQVDAAIARLGMGVQSNSQLFGTEFRPATTAAPSIGMQVTKSGSVSGVTRGIVDGVAGSYRLDYTNFGDGPEWMQGFRVVPDPAAPAEAISVDGDSGSLWVDVTGKSAIGLHFAGEDDISPLNDYALAHPIDAVLSRMGVSFAVL
jgi:hypothetical protein